MLIILPVPSMPVDYPYFDLSEPEAVTVMEKSTRWTVKWETADVVYNFCISGSVRSGGIRYLTFSLQGR